MSNKGKTKQSTSRRRFMAQVSTVTIAGLSATQNIHGVEKPEQKLTPVPMIMLGKHRVTRLVVGSNPIDGYSYMGRHTDRHMREYFTPERTVEFLEKCERSGINTFQSPPTERFYEALSTLRQRGSKLQYICLHSGISQIKNIITRYKPIAVVHHGGVTDQLFATGKKSEVHDFVKAVRDEGILAGVSAHNPDCVKLIADEDWPVDFFMTCFYYLTRKMVPDKKEKKPVTLPIGYHFYMDDPTVMARVVRQVSQPCLGFKILAAGRKCGSEQSVRGAFRFAFENIKPTDGVIVGMYPRFQNEIADNVSYVREFASQSKKG